MAEVQARMFVVPRHHVRRARLGGPPVHPGDDLAGRRRRSTPRSAPCRRTRPFLRHTTALFADLAPGARALRRTAPEIADAATVGVPALLAAPGFNRQLPPTAASLRRFNDDAGGAGGHRPADHILRRAQPDAAVHHPRAVGVQLRDAAVQQRRRHGRGSATASATGSGSSCSRHRALRRLRTTRAVPSSAPASGGGGDPANFLHVNPYPNTASPGQPRECEAGREHVHRGQDVIGNPPGNQGVTPEAAGWRAADGPRAARSRRSAPRSPTTSASTGAGPRGLSRTAVGLIVGRS